MRAVCLQHVPFEGPGVFAASLPRRGVQLEHHLVPKNGLPRDAGDLLVVMSGAMMRSALRGRGASIKVSWGSSNPCRSSGRGNH
jgi:hypothetical protein